MTFGRRLHVFSTWAPTQDAVHVVESDLSQRHGSESMNDDQRLREETEKVLEATRRRYGFVPVVNQVLSERPDLFLPMTGLARAVLEGEGELDRKQRLLCAIAAATAAGGEYCVSVQTRHALDAGATRGEILEAITIGSYMAMTRAQSYAYRRYAELFDIELDQ